MLTFWLVALLMVVVALVMLLPAFWGRYQSTTTTFSEQNIKVARDRLTELKQQRAEKVISEEEYNQQRSELEQTLALDLNDSSQSDNAMLGDKRIIHVLILAFVIPVVSLSLYFSLGSPEVLLQQGNSQRQQQVSSGQVPQHTMQELITRLEKRLQENPADAEGWMMLGRTYMTLKRYSDASRAFEKVISQIGEKASVLLALADATAMSNNGQISGKPLELVEKALAMSPNEPTGLWLAGMGYEEQGRYRKAIQSWQKLLPLLKDEQSKQKVNSMISRANSHLGDNPVEAPASTVATSQDKSILVNVDIAPALKNKIPSDTTVFIFARPKSGSRMPLAVVRKLVKDLPVQVTLNDAMAMTEATRLSQFNAVNVVARVSFSGSAMAQPGDYQSDTQVAEPGQKGMVKLLIEKQLP